MSGAAAASLHEDENPHSRKAEQGARKGLGSDGITAQLCHLRSHRSSLRLGNPELVFV